MKYLDELKKLNLPKDKFAVFGSGPMAIRGIRETNDVDIVVKQDLWKEIVKKHPMIKENLVQIGNISIYKDWLPWFDDTDFLIDQADIISGLRFVKLEYVLKWKRMIDREKDRKDIKLIEEFLKRNR